MKIQSDLAQRGFAEREILIIADFLILREFITVLYFIIINSVNLYIIIIINIINNIYYYIIIM